MTVTVDAAVGSLTARLRLYNGGAEAVTLTPDDMWIAFGYVENPPGPRVPAEALAAFALLPGQAADMTLVWPWSGERFGSMGVGAWVFAAAF